MQFRLNENLLGNFYHSSAYFDPRLLVFVPFDFFLRDFEGDRCGIIFRYNLCIAEVIDEMLNAPNKVIRIAEPDSFGDNADSVATRHAMVMDCFSLSNCHRFIPSIVFKEGVRFFTHKVIFSPASIT